MGGVSPDEHLRALFAQTGRTALVTGGSSGIGKAIATSLARAGARVVVLARGEAALANTVAELTDEGGTAAYVVADLGSRAGVHDATEQVVKHFGEPDVVVSAAGVNLRPPLAELTAADWDTTMAVNLAAPFLLGQRFGPGMAARGFGRLIHLSSQQAHRAFVDSGAYGVSKGGLEALARSQAEALSGSGVTANVLVPGFVMTPLNARLASDPVAVKALAARTMVGRNGLAEDFAAAALFLAGAGSAYVTGQSLFVDGGMSVH